MTAILKIAAIVAMSTCAVFLAVWAWFNHKISYGRDRSK